MGTWRMNSQISFPIERWGCVYSVALFSLYYSASIDLEKRARVQYLCHRLGTFVQIRSMYPDKIKSLVLSDSFS